MADWAILGTIGVVLCLVIAWLLARPRGKWCRARHILVKTEAEADAVLKRLREGEGFEGLAQELSTCPSGKSGGQLGTFKPGSMAPGFDRVCFEPASAIAEPLGPVQTHCGFHVIVIDARGGVDVEKAKLT
eukprot:TRINITY_DN29613_c0_g1_i1.p2 TRINITY_DN29613_c0_g1~~TRINITY_DN29613_c0_g1_i1.p2  ORF type:complete len:131 (-),score=26.76 TRINITY_DN29613_c0_g1_i1:18-410(-)